VQRRFAVTSCSSLQQIRSQSFYEFLGVVNVNTFLPLNPNEANRAFNNCSEQPSLEWTFASVSFLLGISLNTAKQVTVKK